MKERKEIKVCPQVIQGNQHLNNIPPQRWDVNYHDYYAQENKELRIERLEEEIEYLKAELPMIKKMDENVETLFVRTLDFEDLSDVTMNIEERLQDMEELITFQDVANIMTKEYKERLFRNRTGGERKGFINLHIRDEVKYGEVLKKSIEEIKNKEE